MVDLQHNLTREFEEKEVIDTKDELKAKLESEKWTDAHYRKQEPKIAGDGYCGYTMLVVGVLQQSFLVAARRSSLGRGNVRHTPTYNHSH